VLHSRWTDRRLDLDADLIDTNGMGKSTPSLREKLAYKIDNVMSLNPLAKLFGLAGLSVLIVAMGGLAYMAVSRDKLNVFQSWWAAWLFVADAGNQADASTTFTRAVAMLITIGGLMIFALLLGIVSESLGEKLEEMKKGKSRVIESGHSLILGWEEKIFSLIAELIEANANQKRGVIVILSDQDKQAMEEEIQHKIADFKTTVIVCRSGNQTDAKDLAKVSAQEARSVVVLGDPHNPEESDVRAIKTVLALQRSVGSLQGHVVVEIMERANKPIVEMVGQGNVEVVLPRDIMGRLMVQTSRQNHLAQTYGSLLGFAGSEFYLQGYDELAGKTFADVWPLFPDAIICGVEPKKGRDGFPVWINPPNDYVMQPGDRLLALAEDDDTFSIKPVPAGWQPSAAPAFAKAEKKPEALLFLGWRRDIGVMLRELDSYMAPGSTLTLVSTLDREQFGARLKHEGVVTLTNIKLQYGQANLTSRKDLEALKVQQYASILLLADETEERTPDEVDARTLLSLLLIRDIQKHHDAQNRPVLSEIRDPRTKELAKVAEASDYVVSNEIISMLLANVSENRSMNNVWADLFASEGSEIYLKNALRYAKPEEAVTFYDIQARARSVGELALGYARAQDLEKDPVAGLVINPANKVIPLTFTADDRVIVLAESDE
jgi:Trk K+ transport system NAD-binding subunit